MNRIVCCVSNDLVHDQRMARICSGLTKAGHKVTLLGRRRSNSAPLTTREYRQRRLGCLVRKGKLFYFILNLRLFLWLMTHRCRIVYAVDLDTMPAGRVAAAFWGRQLVYDAHEWFTEVPELLGRDREKAIWGRVGRATVGKAKLRLTVGDMLAKQLSTAYNCHFDVIRNLPRLQSELPDPTPTPTLLYQGALNAGRGLEVAIQAMQNIEGRLIIAGDGDLTKELKQLTRDMELQHRVEFVGMLKPAELLTLTRTAWLGFNLLEERSLSYRYSLANKFFDYIMAGVPTVQMNFPEYARIQEQWEVAYLLNELNPEAVAHAANTLITDNDLRARLSTNCVAARRELCWENEEQHLLALFGNLT